MVFPAVIVKIVRGVGLWHVVTANGAETYCGIALLESDQLRHVTEKPTNVCAACVWKAT